MKRINRKVAIYLLQETCLFLLLSYLVLLGGTFNGLVLYSLNQINFILIVVFGFFWIILRSIKRLEFPRTILDIGLLLFLIAAVISVIFSADPRRSLIGFAVLIIAVLIFYLFVDLIRNGLPIELINKVLLIVSGFILFFGIRELYLWYGGWIDIAGFKNLIPPATYRVRAFLGHPNFVAAFLNLLLPLGLARIILTNNKTSRIALAFWLALVFVLIFFTSSRGGWLGTLFAILTFLILFGFARWDQLKDRFKSLITKKWVLFGIAVIVLAGMIALVLLLQWQSRHPTHPSDWSDIFASRNYIWAVARDMVQNKPITGNGLFTFGSEYLKAESVPPNMLLAHAHNYYFNVAAEMGLLGLVGLIVLCIGFAVMVLKAWKSHQFLNKIEIAGLCGSLMGLAVHSLFETPQSMPLLMFLPGILIAQIASGVDSGKHKSTPWAGNGSLFVLWLTASILMGFDLRALTPYRTGLQLAKDEKLIKAETMVEEAINKDPNNALYWSQLGLISGQVAFKEKGDDHYRPVLEKAIEAYQKAVEIEPSYSVNWINLGILQWEGGYQDQAISSVNTAVEKSPKQAGFFLTLGRMYESVGNLSGAWNAYRQALKIDPYRLQSPFFDETEYRLSFSEYWEIRKHTTSDIDDKRLEEGWRLYNQGMYAQALELFQDTPGFNVPEVYLARGRAYSKLGNYQSAEKAYRTALWMRSDDGRLNVEVYLGLGELAAAEGNHVAAVEAFQKAADLMENTSSFGIGKLGESQYSWYIFYKPSLAEDLLPGVDKDPYTDEMINALHYNANWYYDSNQVDTAEESYLRILNLRPHDQVALERYNELKLRNE